jgi:hypothetical protein
MKTKTADTVVSPIALAGLAIAFVALTLVIIGMVGGKPYGLALRFPVEKLTGFKAIYVYGLSFVGPIVLGLLAAGLGATAFTSIERSNGRLIGNGAAVFSILIGLLSVVTATIISFAVLVYPAVA